MATEVLREKEQINYLRAKIRAAANQSLQIEPNNLTAIDTLRILRRKLSLQDCQRLLEQQLITNVEAEAEDDLPANSTTTMTASNGQIVRHHHSSNKEHIDKERTPIKKETTIIVENAPITVQELLSACPEAAQFSLRKIETPHDVIAHARTLAPMIGINTQSYDAAQERLGSLRTAATVWAIMQFHEKIKAVGAYFRSITTGSKSAGFSPEKLVRRLAAAQSYAN